MALLFMEGFATDDTTTKWSGGSIISIATGGARISGGSYAQISNGLLYKNIPASNKVILGLGATHSSTNGFAMFFSGDAGTTTHITVMRNTSGLIEIRRGNASGTILATGTSVLPVSQWAYVEASVTISDTVGEVHVRLNGLGSDEVSFTGDTKNAGTNTTIDRVWVNTVSGAGGVYITDVYMLDDTGSAPNNAFLGDVVVRTLSPNGNGNSSQLVGSDGNSTDNYLLVDEKPFSSADYAGSATPGNKDTYALTDLPASVSAVYGVQVNANILKSDGGLIQARTVVRTGSTDYGGTTRTLTTSASTYHQLYEQNPNTSAQWTASNVNGLEAGMEVM